MSERYFIISVYLNSSYSSLDTPATDVNDTNPHCIYFISGVKHLEELRQHGLEMPAVNQIEVRNHRFTVLFSGFFL